MANLSNENHSYIFGNLLLSRYYSGFLFLESDLRYPIATCYLEACFLMWAARRRPVCNRHQSGGDLVVVGGALVQPAAVETLRLIDGVTGKIPIPAPHIRAAAPRALAAHT